MTKALKLDRFEKIRNMLGVFKVDEVS